MQHRDEHHAGGGPDEGGNQPLLEMVQELVDHDCPSVGDAQAGGGVRRRRPERNRAALRSFMPDAAEIAIDRDCLPTRPSTTLWIGSSSSIHALRWAAVR